MFLVFKKRISEFFDTFLNLIYKQKCIICSCGKTNEIVCKTCLKDVHYLSNFPHRIYKEIPIYSATKYENTVKKLFEGILDS